MLLPVIHIVDRRLSGWLATFLSWGGRLTLINSVQSGIPSYLMTCFQWPKESLQKLDALLRDFFWQGKNTVKGGKCLMAWDMVTLPRANGGLGVRNLEAHNQALLCKFVAKILQSSDIPCFSWFASQYCKDSLPFKSHHKDTAIWKGLKSYIPLVVSSSRCSVGSGAHASFWHDRWLLPSSLKHAFLVLFSFARNPNCLVQSQFTGGAWNVQLHPNLT